MIRLEFKLALFNLFSKLVFTGLFLLLMPIIFERINLRQVDNELVQKREKIINLVSEIGIEPFITSDTTLSFGSYNILKEEFISLEKADFPEEMNLIEVTSRLIEGEEIGYRVLNYTFIVDGRKYLLEVGKSLSVIQNTKKNITRVIIVFMAFIIIITLVTELQYNRYLLRPLNKITAKLSCIPDPEHFDKTDIKTTTSDLYQLDRALKGLMERIEEHFRKEKEITVNISHELMTPISVLRSKLENILLNPQTGSETAVSIEESLRTLHRLQSLVSSLLLIARIESRQYLCEDTFSITGLLKEVVEEIYPVAEDNGITFNEVYQTDLEIINANRSLVFSMFHNVINNAVRKTPGGGKIDVSSRPENGSLVVSISDNGTGMTTEQIETLFTRFKKRNGHDNAGTGIGLAITKSIADLHGIKISVKSEVNRGTDFSFIFP